MSLLSLEKVLDNLPQHLLEDFAIQIASQSLDDLTSLKISSKSLLAAAGSEYVLKNISLDNVEIDPWRPHEPHIARLLKKCKHAGNPDIYYMQGLKQYFNGNRGRKRGLNLLGKACKDGQKEAGYFLCMLGFCAGGEAQQDSLEILNKVKKKHPNWDYDLSRNKIAIRLRSLWIYDGIDANPFIFNCPRPLHTLRRLRDLDFKEDEELQGCSHCRWYRQYVLFARMFNIEI